MFNARLGLSLITFLVLTTTVVHGASTGHVLTGLLLSRLREYRTTNHAKRQGSNSSGLSLDDFPQQCQPGCKVAVDTLNTCSVSSCICTSAVEQSLQDCINCTVGVEPDPTVVKDGQQVFDTFNALCKGTGVPTLSLTVVTLSSTSTGSSSFINPFLPPASTPTATVPNTLGGPTTTITIAPATGGLPSNTLLGTPSTTKGSIASGLPLIGNDAVALPRASKAYAAVGLIVAFFMCLA